MFISKETLEYPLSLPDVRDRLQQTLLPSNPTDEQMSYIKYPRVQPTAKPGGDVVTEGQPEWREGVPYQTWDVREFTPEEVEAMKPPALLPYFTPGDVWGRITEEEGEVFGMAMDEQSYKIRGLWRNADKVLALDEDPDPTLRGTARDRTLLYKALKGICVPAFGEERTAELLAPSGDVQV